MSMLMLMFDILQIKILTYLINIVYIIYIINITIIDNIITKENYQTLINIIYLVYCRGSVS